MTSMNRDADPATTPEPCGAVQRATAWITEMASLEVDVEQDSDRIALLTVMEAVKAASAAVQVRVTAEFVDSQTAAAQEMADAELASIGLVPRELQPAMVRRSVCAQIALARREAPDRGPVLVNFAEALTRDLPATMAALASGATSEYRSMLVHRETACLSPELRRQADRALAEALPRLGNRQAGERAREQALRLDPEAAKHRIRAAVGGRRVTLRRAPDAMAYLTAVLPAGAATVCLQSLTRPAEAEIASGVAGSAPRPGRGALMADTLVDRITQGLIAGCDELGAPSGRSTSESAADRGGTADPAGSTDSTGTDGPLGSAAEAEAEDRPGSAHDAGIHAESQSPAERLPTQPGQSLDLQVHLVMTDRAMFGADDEPAQLIGYGPIPAELARRMIAAGLGSKARTWIRRLFTEPESGRLAAMESRSRFFPDSLKEFLLARDRQCRMPYCGAPARHADHTVSHANGGPTSADNGACTSVNCNLLKEAHGWFSDTAPDGTITVHTPTGHRHWSDEPPPPRSQPWDGRRADFAAATSVTDPAATAAPESPVERQAQPAEWERILEAALAGAEPTPRVTWSAPPAVAGGGLKRLRGKLSREGSGSRGGHRPRPPFRRRRPPLNPAAVRRRLDLLRALREGVIDRQ